MKTIIYLYIIIVILSTYCASMNVTGNEEEKSYLDCSEEMKYKLFNLLSYETEKSFMSECKETVQQLHQKLYMYNSKTPIKQDLYKCLLNISTDRESPYSKRCMWLETLETCCNVKK